MSDHDLTAANDDGLSDSFRVRGAFRLNIEDETGKIVGDSGWRPNLITNLGRNYYLVDALAQLTGSLFVNWLALGTGTSPSGTDMALSGEVAKRAAVTATSSSNSSTVQFVGTFNSTQSFIAAGTSSLSNIGLFASSTGGTLFAENTYASSACTTNQNVNVSYVISFS